MEVAKYTEALRLKLKIESHLVEIDAMFRKFPETDPNDTDLLDDARPLLHLLIEEESDELIEFFLEKCPIKADPNLVDAKTEATPLCLAI